jgi:hypothetical protein
MEFKQGAAMPTLVTCPECHERFADQRCPKCEHVFQAKPRAPYTESIQAKSAPTGPAAKTSTPEWDEEDDKPIEHPPKPRAPFPWNALLILLLGVLFFALVFSAVFNVWFILRPDNDFLRGNPARQIEQQAIERQRQAEIQAEQARQREQAAQERARQLETALERERERNRQLEKLLKK